MRSSKTCRMFFNNNIYNECIRFKRFFDVFVFNFICIFSIFFILFSLIVLKKSFWILKKMKFDLILNSLFEIILMWVVKLFFLSREWNSKKKRLDEKNEIRVKHVARETNLRRLLKKQNRFFKYYYALNKRENNLVI